MKLRSIKKAFSLIELSIVILIIGIIIAGITQSTRIMDQHRLSSARSQTQSSPVNSMKDLLVWYESTLEESFVAKETDDYDNLTAAEKTLGKGVISTWYDISASTGTRDNLTQSTAGYKPQYLADCINDLPCINFDGTDDLLSFAGTKISEIAASNYTIFIVNKKTDTGDAVKIMLGSSASETLHIGYKDNDEISWGHVASNYSTNNPASVALEDNKPTLHVFVNEVIGGFDTDTPANNYFYYANGDTASETLVEVSNGVSNAVATGLASYASQTVGYGLFAGTGYYYTGAIGEIIIFKRALKADERDSVEDYLIKKWRISPDNS